MIGALIALVVDASAVMSQENAAQHRPVLSFHRSVGAPMVSKHYMTISGDIPEGRVDEECFKEPIISAKHVNVIQNDLLDACEADQEEVHCRWSVEEVPE